MSKSRQRLKLQTDIYNIEDLNRSWREFEITRLERHKLLETTELERQKLEANKSIFYIFLKK